MISAASTWQDFASGAAAIAVVLAFLATVSYSVYKFAGWIHEVTDNSRATKNAAVEVQQAVTPNHGMSMADDVNAIKDDVGQVRQMQETGAEVIQHLVKRSDENRDLIVGVDNRLQTVEEKVSEVRQEQVTQATTGEIPITTDE